MAELKPCPRCKRVPSIGYACGEYFVMSEDDDCPVCGVAGFTEMHSSEEQEIQVWNRMVDNYIREKLVELIGSTVYGKNSKVGENFQRGFIEKIADHLISNGVTVLDWRPASEPPENFVSVLGYMTDADPFPPVRECYSIGNGFYFPALGGIHSVSHWCEMPQPPKGD